MSYVDITKSEFEAWLSSLGHPWKLKPGTRGCYLVGLSDRVALHITSTLGDERSKGYAQAAGQMRLVSLVTDHCLNRKAQGQKHFKRTSGWRKTWGAGVSRMVAAYNECPDFYERIALPEDQQDKPEEPEIVGRMRKAWKAAKAAGNVWEMEFLEDIAPCVKKGKPLSEKQQLALNRILDCVKRDSEGTRKRGFWRSPSEDS